MKLEINKKIIKDSGASEVAKTGILITPPIDQDYWIVRVNLFEDQYVQAFPKFTTYGIGFAIEEDWNTNLPYTSNAKQICEHIWHNRRYISIRKNKTIKAIEMIQEYIKEMKI